MALYRLYSVDRAGKIVAAEALIARSDDEAFDRARALNKESDCEIWNRSKFVGTCPRPPKDRHV